MDDRIAVNKKIWETQASVAGIARGLPFGVLNRQIAAEKVQAATKRAKEVAEKAQATAENVKEAILMRSVQAVIKELVIALEAVVDVVEKMAVLVDGVATLFDIKAVSKRIAAARTLVITVNELFRLDFYSEIEEITAGNIKKILEFARIATEAAGAESEEYTDIKTTIAWRTLVDALQELEERRTGEAEIQMTNALVKAFMWTEAAAASDHEEYNLGLCGNLRPIPFSKDSKRIDFTDISKALVKRAQINERIVENWFIIETSPELLSNELRFSISQNEIFAQTVRMINNMFAKGLGLDLRITLHRFLLLDLLDKNRHVENPSGIASSDPLLKEESLDENFEGESEASSRVLTVLSPGD